MLGLDRLMTDGCGNVPLIPLPLRCQCGLRGRGVAVSGRSVEKLLYDPISVHRGDFGINPPAARLSKMGMRIGNLMNASRLHGCSGNR